MLNNLISIFFKEVGKEYKLPYLELFTFLIMLFIFLYFFSTLKKYFEAKDERILNEYSNQLEAVFLVHRSLNIENINRKELNDALYKLSQVGDGQIAIKSFQWITEKSINYQDVNYAINLEIRRLHSLKGSNKNPGGFLREAEELYRLFLSYFRPAFFAFLLWIIFMSLISLIVMLGVGELKVLDFILVVSTIFVSLILFSLLGIIVKSLFKKPYYKTWRKILLVVFIGSGGGFTFFRASTDKINEFAEPLLFLFLHLACLIFMIYIDKETFPNKKIINK